MLQAAARVAGVIWLFGSPALAERACKGSSRKAACTGKLSTLRRITPMWTLLAVAAAISVAAGLVAVGFAYYDFHPWQTKEHGRTQQEVN